MEKYAIEQCRVDDMKLLKKLDKSKYLGVYKVIENRLSEDILPFAQVNTPFHNDHGVGHSKRVIEYIEKILGEKGIKNLNSTETFLLLASAWFHDIGLLINEHEGVTLTSEEIRIKHHILSQSFVKKNYAIFGIDSEYLGRYIGDICFSHRRIVQIDSVFPQEYINLFGKKVHLKFLAGILRLSDSLDCDERRAPEIDSNYIMKLPETQINHWRSCQLISGIGIDHGNQSIIIDASQRVPEDYEIILWKIKDVYSEFDSVSDILHKNGIHLSKLIGRIRDLPSNSFSTFDIKNVLTKEKEIADSNLEARNECVETLMRLWKAKSSVRNKISESQEIFKNYKKYPFSKDVSLLYLRQAHIMEYFDKGICKSKLHLTLNLSNPVK